MIRFVTPGAIRETYVLIILNSTIAPHMLTVTIQLSFIAYVQRLNSMDITSFSVSNPLFLSLITALSFFFSLFPLTAGWLLSREHGGKRLTDDSCSWFLHRTYVCCYTISLSFTFIYKFCFVTCFKMLSLILYFRFQTVISHRPSYHMYFVIYCFVFLWSYYFFWLQIDFIAAVWLTKCVCHQDHVLSVINTEWVSFLWLCGLYNKIVLIAGNELSWFKIRINCLTQYFYELLLLCTLKYKNAQSMS